MSSSSVGTCPLGGQWYTCEDQAPTFFGCCTSNPCNGVGCPASDLRAAGMGTGSGPDADTNDGSYWPNVQCPLGGSWYTCPQQTPSFQGCCETTPSRIFECPCSGHFLDTFNCCTLNTTLNKLNSGGIARNLDFTLILSTTPVGTIVGGTVGGVVGGAIIITILILIYLRRRNRQETARNSAFEPELAVPTHEFKGCYKPYHERIRYPLLISARLSLSISKDRIASAKSFATLLSFTICLLADTA
ncbi:Transmembrane domain of the Epidermal Growth Factor Receptor family of Tyrosine Kinase protein [Rutstroemia sp. NJR-2017a BBW]|nr:Transmembrane domain of the Epidermal Growth Factor Receptor family of Tyrosine Kinase protein [Rutstroemia sp. NJR-2017a BBW]